MDLQPTHCYLDAAIQKLFFESCFYLCCVKVVKIAFTSLLLL